MKKISIILLILVIGLGVFGVLAQGIPSSEVIHRRGFYTDDQEIRQVRYYIEDKTLENGEITLDIKYATSKERWYVIEFKDLFMEMWVSSQSQNSSARIFVADVCFDQVVWGGDADGEMFEWYCSAIDFTDLPTISEDLFYHNHVVLGGFTEWEPDGDYDIERELDGIIGGQIDVEIQLFIYVNETTMYQEYLVDQFIYEEGSDPTDGTAIIPVKYNSNTADTPAFELLIVIISFGSLILIKKRWKR